LQHNKKKKKKKKKEEEEEEKKKKKKEEEETTAMTLMKKNAHYWSPHVARASSFFSFPLQLKILSPVLCPQDIRWL
jgi:hypothetical protein